MTPSISIIIPSYNAQKNLSKCLEALDNQWTDIPYEIIVVDCSEHQLVEEICHRFKKVKYFHEKERFNPGIGRNIGAKQAEGEYLVFVDSDVIVEKDLVENIHQAALEGSKVFGGALEHYRKDSVSLASVFEHQFFNHENQKNRRKYVRKNLSSALLIIEKKLFMEMKGFSNIPRMQDTELTERIVNYGENLYFIPSVVGYQIQNSSFKKVLQKIATCAVRITWIFKQQA